MKNIRTDYGAVGDGITDDTAAIHLAFFGRTTPLPAVISADGDALYFPAGVYMTDPQAFTVPNGIVIFGDGIDKTIIRARTFVSAQFAFFNTASKNVVFENLTIDVNRVENERNPPIQSITGIKIGDNTIGGTTIKGLAIRRVKVMGATVHGIQIIRASSPIVTECEVDDHSKFGILGFRATTGARFTTNYVHSTQLGCYGIALDDLSGTEITTNNEPPLRNIIGFNTIEGNNKMEGAIDVEGSRSTSVISNTIYQPNDWGIMLNSSDDISDHPIGSEHNTVVGNTIVAQANSISISTNIYASIVVRGRFNSVIGNTILDGKGVGILVEKTNNPIINSQGNVIANNTIYNNLQSGILFTIGSGDLVKGNTIWSITGGYGIRLAPSDGPITNVTLEGNTIYKAFLDGISLESGASYPASDLRVFGNQIIDCNLLGAPASYFGIAVRKSTQALERLRIEGNSLVDDQTTASMVVGIRLSAGANTVRVVNNSAHGVTTPVSVAAGGILVALELNSWQDAVDTMTYAATISIDFINASNFHKTTVTGNATINANGPGVAGQRMRVMIINDATSRTITFGANFRPNGTLIGSMNKAAVVEFISDGSAFFEMSRASGL